MSLRWRRQRCGHLTLVVCLRVCAPSRLYNTTALSMSPRTSTIPYTPTSPGWTSVHPRPLRPIRAHPNLEKTPTPALPSPPRPPVFHTTPHGVYRLTTHLVPAAYPRLAPDIPPHEIPAHIPGGLPAERRDKIDALAKQILQTQNAYEEGRLGGTPGEKLLWNCINRYVRTPTLSRTAGITLFLAHANGFHKEASGCFGGALMAR